MDPPSVALPRLLRDYEDPTLRPVIVQILAHAAHNSQLKVLVESYIVERLERTFSDYLRAWLLPEGSSLSDAASLAAELTPAVVALVQGSMVRQGILGDGQEASLSASVAVLLRCAGL